MKVLVVSYSQTGQLREIVSNVVSQLEHVDIDDVMVEPKNPYPFPWTSKEFFGVMPDSVHENPIELKPISFKHQTYDLVIFAYQPWYLSVSLPMISIAKNHEFQTRLKDTPVITIIGSRNMWINSQEKLWVHMKRAGAKLVGTIPFVDKSQNLVSVVTILHWLIDGKKTRKYNIFPVPGVRDNDVAFAAEYGRVLNVALQNDALDSVQEQFLAFGKIKVNTSLLFIERVAKRIFIVWASLAARYQDGTVQRERLLAIFKYYLVVALFVVSPIVLTVYNILFVPLLFPRIKKEKRMLLSNKFD